MARLNKDAREVVQMLVDAAEQASIVGGQARIDAAIAEARALLSQPAAQPEPCFCDKNKLGEPGVSCGDCPTRDYKSASPAAAVQPKPQELPSWACPMATVTPDGLQCPTLARCKDCPAAPPEPNDTERGAARTLRQHIDELIAQHGTLRAVSRALCIDVGYLHRLRSGDKQDPSAETLAKLGLVRLDLYAAAPHPTPTAQDAFDRLNGALLTDPDMEVRKLSLGAASEPVGEPQPDPFALWNGA